MKKIGILTGGGDCPGLNAVIRAVTKDALRTGMEVIGFEDGFAGLVSNRARPLTMEDVSGILTQGGTILGSCNRGNPMRLAQGRNPDGTPIFIDVSPRCINHYTDHKLDALVVIGGDGTMTSPTTSPTAASTSSASPKPSTTTSTAPTSPSAS
jgi:6-phosphofructokinase 1